MLKFCRTNCDMSQHNCGRCSALSSLGVLQEMELHVPPFTHSLLNSQRVNKVLTQGVIQRFKDVNCNLSKLQTVLSNVAKNCRPWHFCAVRDCNLQSRTIKRFSKKSIPILSTRKLKLTPHVASCPWVPLELLIFFRDGNTGPSNGVNCRVRAIPFNFMFRNPFV